MSLRQEIASVMHTMTLARMHKAESILKHEPGQTGFRICMCVEKQLAEAELDALDKILREVYFPKCIHRVITDDDNHDALCNNLVSEYYGGPCDISCDQNIEDDND